MVKFARKKTLTTDTMVSQYFSDMYDGGTTTANLTGGLKQSKYLIEADIASKPVFGDAVLDSLEFDFYANSVSLGDNSVKYPEVAAYLFKDNQTLTEGKVSRVDEDLLVFSSYVNGSKTMSDNFDGTGTSGDDGSRYENIKRTVIKEDILYTTIDRMVAKGKKGSKLRSGDDDRTFDQLSRDFGVGASDLGIPLPATVGGITPKDDKAPVFARVSSSTRKDDGYMPGGDEKTTRKCIPNDAHSGIGYSVFLEDKSDRIFSATQKESTTEGYGTEANPSNTFFESIKGANEFSDYDSNNDKTTLHGVGIARFNTENFLAGAQSLELFTFITGGSGKDKVKYAPKGGVANGRTVTSGPSDRQEVCLVKKNIPYPVNKVPRPTKTRDGILRIVASDKDNNRFLLDKHGLTTGTEIKLTNVSGITIASGGSTVDPATTNFYVAENTENQKDVNGNNFRVVTSSSNFFDNRCTITGTDDLSIDLEVVADADGNDIGSYDEPEVGSVIEMDINIKTMAKAHTHTLPTGTGFKGQDGSTGSGSSVTSNAYTLRRGFHIVFGTSPPNADETLYDYVGRLTGLDIASGAAYYKVNASDIPGSTGDGMDGTSDSQTLWSVRGRRGTTIPNTNTLAGVSFINTENGLEAVPWNGKQGSSSADADRISEGLYITDHDSEESNTSNNSSGAGPQDLIFFADNSGNHVGAMGTRTSIPCMDQWTRLSFIVSPGGSVDVPAFHGSTSNTEAQKGHYSFGKLHISNQKDGFMHDTLDIGLLGNNGNFASFNDSEGIVSSGSLVGDSDGGHLYEIVSYTSGSAFPGAADNNVGTKFIATGAGSGTGTAKNLDQRVENWPSHMSIWVTNSEVVKANASSGTAATDVLAETTSDDMKTVVLLDSVKLKDFNYDITNSSQIDEIKVGSPIEIRSGEGLATATGASDISSNFTQYLDSRIKNTPSIVSIGVSDRDYLSQDTGTASTNVNTTWTEWPYGFFLNNFSADNLAKVGSIPDYHIKGGFSMSAYTDTPDIIPLGHQLTQKGFDNQEHLSLGFAGTAVPHNMYPNFDDLETGAEMQFATTFLNTGLKILSNDASANQFTVATNALFSDAPIPIRVGDTVRLQKSDSYRGSGRDPTDFTVAASPAPSGSIGTNLVFTVEEDIDGQSSFNSDDDYAGYFIGVQPGYMCRNFSQKGGFMAYANSPDEHVATKRENIACSARVLEILGKRAGEITLQVDTMAPFLTPNGEEFIAYLYGETPTFTDRNSLPDTVASDSANAKTGIKIIAKDIPSRTITLDWNGKDNAGTEIMTYDNISRIFISPYRYWFYFVVNLEDSDNNLLSDRRYGNVILCNNNWSDSASLRRSWTGEGLSATITDDFVDTAATNRSGIGTTFNESLFNDTTTAGVNGAYVNSWQLDKGLENSVLTLDDYGFGEFDKETNKGGYAGFTIAQDSQYNKIKMPNVTSTASLEAGESVNFMIDYKDYGITHTTTLRTRHDSTYPPYLYTIFEDEKPNNPSLKINPYESDPFLPEITWEASDSDLWYGIIHVDSENIISQYHKAIFHMPMNEAGIHGATVSTAGNELFAKDNTSGSTSKTALFTYTNGPLIDSEGLAGNCLRFDGADAAITYTPSSGDALMDLGDAATTGLSIVVHITPDSGISGPENWIYKGLPFWINYDADGGTIQVFYYTTSTSNYVLLTAGGIVVDGETPTCIIATIDTELKSGNCKLYLDGKLVSQSGPISSSNAGTGGNNWYNNSGTPSTAHVAGTAVTIGSGSNSFLGRMEELVIYKTCIYPVVPSDGKLVFDKPLKELRDGTPISNNVRLFVKDYHNIRGSTTDEVAASSPVSFRKAAFRLSD